MKYIVKTFGLFSVIAAVTGADAATPRISVTTKATSRIPSIAGYVKGLSTATTGTSSGTTTTTATSLLTNSECIETYSDCLKAADVCGSDLEECTTNVLLHAKMPNCLSVLYQCSTSGINDLFGTSSITALSNVETKNAYGEITKFTYPTDGSVLGQMVLGAKISNMLTTDQCVRRYTNCVKRDDVCGENFELCTSPKEFKNQSIACASTLARCQGDGLIELFGQTNTSAAPKGTSRLGTAIADGAKYAAANAVKTCYRVADTCLVNACTANPWRCVEGVNMETVSAADFVASGTTDGLTVTSKLSRNADGTVNSDVNLYELTGQDIRKFIKGECLSKIGGNKSCYITFLEKTPKDKDLADIDNQEDVFSLAYGARKSYANAQIQDILKKFDNRAKTKCVDLITECVKNSCGGGLGSVCYEIAKTSDGVHVNNGDNYADIKAGCEAIVNTDANCQYAANSATDGGYVYKYRDSSVFGVLFPEYGSTDGTASSDPIGAVEAVNSLLATSYNDAAIAQMEKDCTNVAIGCVKRECNSTEDYINCYRNRTDVMADVYKTGETKFDRSMNKVGGVLDYTIVTGLCVNEVKNADACQEHLKIEGVKLKLNDGGKSTNWTSTVRNDWVSAARSIKAKNMPETVVVGCKTNSNASGCNLNTIEACGYVDEDGCVYNQEVTETWDSYLLTQSANNLFQRILADVEKEVQAKYNAKMTREQNICFNNNVGGIKGIKDNGSALMWVKLKSNRVPKNYAMKGLTTSQFKGSNDLDGSFCRARVTILSDDKYIQDYLGNDATAYFAVGDYFICGSWISQKTLEKISEYVAEKAAKDAGKDSKKDKWTKVWSTVAGTLAGGIGSYAGMDAIQRNGNTLGGLINPGKDAQTAKNTKDAAKACANNVERARDAYGKASAEREPKRFIELYDTTVGFANRALDNANTIKKAQGDNISGLNLKTGRFQKVGYTYDTEQNQTVAQTKGYRWNDESLKKLNNVISEMKKLRLACVGSCVTNLTRAEDLIKRNPSSKYDGALVIAAVNNAYEECNKSTLGTTCQLQGITVPTSLEVDELVTASAPVVNNTKGDYVDQDEAGRNRYFNRAEYETEFTTNIAAIENYCAEHENVEENNKHRRNLNLVAGTVGAVGGGVLAYKIAQNVLEVKYEEAGDKAAQEWLDDIKNHLKCYLGNEELGDYGDPLVIEID